MKKTNRRKIFTALLTVLSFALGVAIAVNVYNTINPPPQEAVATRPPEPTSVRVVPIEMGDVQNSVVISGEVLAGNQVSANPTVAGKLSDLYVRVGDSVRAGQTIASIDPSRPGEVYSKSPVVSTISGTVLSTPVNIGDSVTAQTAILTIGNLNSLVLETHVPERFSAELRTGLSAEVSFEAMPEERFLAEVYEVSPVLDPSSRTIRIRLRFPNGDDRIKVGMFATIYLVTKESRNVTVLPRSAIINTIGTWICYTVNDQNVAERRVLTLGLESEDMVEIVQGVNSGEMLVIAGQNFLNDAEAVRVVE